MSLPPEVEKMIEAGPRKTLYHDSAGNCIDCDIDESHEDFARRVALIAQEEGFAAGARAQREMEPTEAMIDEGHKVRLNIEVGRASTISALTPSDKAAEIFCAMQRVAPLVGDEK